MKKIIPSETDSIWQIETQELRNKSNGTEFPDSHVRTAEQGKKDYCTSASFDFKIKTIIVSKNIIQTNMQ